MSEPQDDDLRDAFEQLRAPRSTAGYAAREVRAGVGSAAPGPLGMHSWSRIAAAAAVVVVALGGAVAVVGLRNARQVPSAASGGAVPPARAFAAMAYDSTSGLTVMFGGNGATQAPLADTWTWDGGGWSRAGGASPPALVQPAMADDPSDGGVILVGSPAPPSTGTVCGVSGSASGSGSSSSSGSAVPPATPVSVPGSSGGSATTPAPGATAGGVPAITATPSAPCTPSSPAAVQTWIFTNSGWHRAGGSTPPPQGSLMSVVPETGQVVAVAPSGGVVACSGGLECASPAVPALGAPTLCRVTPSGGCAQYVASLRTWVWSAGRWTEAPPLAGEAGAVNTLLPVPAGDGLDLVTVHLAITPLCINADGGCPSVPAPATPSVKAWSWTAQGWKAAATPLSIPPADGSIAAVGGHDPALPLRPADGTIAAVGGHDLLLTTTGHTWTGGPDGWSEASFQSAVGSRTGAALAGARGGQFVLFGGNLTGVNVSTQPGSDTWVWTSGGWRLVSGRPPSGASRVPINCAPADSSGITCTTKGGPPATPGLVTPASAAPATAAATGA